MGRSFDKWMTEGINRGFCGPPVCVLHDGVPTTGEEDAALWDGEEPCHHVVRMYPDAEVRFEVEENHPPSIWRNTWTPKRLVDIPELRDAVED